MAKKNSNVRSRIKQFVDNQNIKHVDFFKKTELSRGLLDTDKLDKDVGADKLTNILVNYSELNSEWLLTGKGEMLKEEKSNAYTSENSNNVVSKPSTQYNNEVVSLLKNQLKDKDKIITTLEKENVRLEEENRSMKEELQDLRNELIEVLKNQNKSDTNSGSGQSKAG